MPSAPLTLKSCEKIMRVKNIIKKCSLGKMRLWWQVLFFYGQKKTQLTLVQCKKHWDLKVHVRNMPMKIKAEKYQLGNGEIFQNHVDQLPSGGVARGASSPTPRWWNEKSSGRQVHQIKVQHLLSRSAFVKWEGNWRKKLNQAVLTGSVSETGKGMFAGGDIFSWTRQEKPQRRLG